LACWTSSTRSAAISEAKTLETLDLPVTTVWTTSRTLLLFRRSSRLQEVSRVRVEVDTVQKSRLGQIQGFPRCVSRSIKYPNQHLHKEERQAYQRRISLQFQNQHHEIRKE
jgi:hypothetical protein